MTMQRKIKPPKSRFQKKVRLDAGTGCHIWTGCLAGPGGYGRSYDGEKNSVYAHRFAYELSNGPVPEGMSVHHKCHNKQCVNPAHLEAVSKKEHASRHPEVAVYLGKLRRGRKPTKRTHGFPVGIFKNKCDRYVARIGLPGKRVYLGTFETAEMASSAYQKAFEEHSASSRTKESAGRNPRCAHID